jgi:hypothetical protein
MKRRPGKPLPLEVQQLLAPFFPGFDLSQIRIYEGIPRYVLIGSAIEPVGYTDCNRIYLTPGAYRVDSIEGLALLAHEITHCRQYKQHGTWRFRAKYLLAYFKNRRRGMTGQNAYLSIPFEIEAREIEAKTYAALHRLQSQLFTQTHENC